MSRVLPTLVNLKLVAELGSPVLKHNGPIRAVRVTPDGKRIVSIGKGANVHVWDAATGEPICDLAGSDVVPQSLAVSRDGKRVFVGGTEAQLFELATKRRIASPLVRTPPVLGAAFGPDNSLVFGDGRIPRRFDANGAELASLAAHKSQLAAIAISRDGSRALTCSRDHKIKLHAVSGSPEVLAAWDGDVESCGFSPDGTLTWSVGYQAAIVRGMTTGKPVFVRQLDMMKTGAMSADGGRFAIATNAATVVYALPAKQTIAKLAFAATTLAFTPDGRRLVLANDRSAVVFDVDTEHLVLPADVGSAAAIEDLAIPADLPHVMFSIDSDGVVVMWDLDSCTAIERICNVGTGRALACTRDGKTLVTSSVRELLAWDVRRTESSRFAIEDLTWDVVISPDGRHVAVGDSAGGVQVFEIATRKRVMKTRAARAQNVRSLAFASDGVLVSGSSNGTAGATELPSGTRLWAESPGSYINTACVAGATAIFGTTGGLIVGWEAATGLRRSVLRDSGPVVERLCTLDADHVAVLQRGYRDLESSMLELWCVSTRSRVGSADLSPLGAQARSIVASPDGRRVYVGTNTSRILVFERD